jgi:hypothetical protein
LRGAVFQIFAHKPSIKEETAKIKKIHFFKHPSFSLSDPKLYDAYQLKKKSKSQQNILMYILVYVRLSKKDHLPK